ncbi:MAG: hypothetical protein L0229_01955 [Blastocatellia bacterium]|nr:hypothetical protein [Blastocatellia bacterium]
MLKIRQKQIDIFRAPMRARAPDRILHDLQTRGVQVEVDETSGDIDIRKSSFYVTDALGHKTRLSFHTDSLPARLITPSGAQYEFSYDTEGRLVAITTPGGERVAIRLDERGNICELKRAGLCEYALRYETDGRFLSAKYPDDKEIRLTYGIAGRLISITDRAGRATFFNRSEDGRLLSVTDPLGRTTVFETDEEDGAQSIIFPDGSRLQYEFDPDTNTATITKRDGEKVIHVLNEPRRIASILRPDGAKIEYEFDEKAGNKSLCRSLTARNDWGAIDCAYDDAGRPVTEATSAGIVKYDYDREGRLVKLTASQGCEIEYQYDEDGRIIAVKDLEGRLSSFIYGPDGTLTEIRYGNGVIEKREHPRAGPLERATGRDKYGRELGEQSYTYDTGEQIIGYTDSWGERSRDRISRRFNRDAEGRIRFEIDALTGKPLAGYSYDAKGNLTSYRGLEIEVGLMDEPLSYGPNQIEYDPSGNMRRMPGEKGWIECEYSSDGTLVYASVEGKALRFEYDALGRRVLKTCGRSTWRYGWAGRQLLWEEFREHEEAHALRRDYIFLPGGITPIAFREPGRAFWLQTSPRGAVIRVFDSDGKVAWRAVYEPFGWAKVEVHRVHQPWRLMGHYRDEETGLHFTSTLRYYSPFLKSYISPAQSAFEWRATRYSYARNDPYNLAQAERGRVIAYRSYVGTAAPIPNTVGTIDVAGAVSRAVDAGIDRALKRDPLAGVFERERPVIEPRNGRARARPFLDGLIGEVAGAFAESLMEQWRRGDEVCVRKP